jgi:hypothetical protein
MPWADIEATVCTVVRVKKCKQITCNVIAYHFCEATGAVMPQQRMNR